MQSLAKIKSYLERAEELRTIAQDFRSPETQWMLTSLARDYERMAEMVEKGLPTSAHIDGDIA